MFFSDIPEAPVIVDIICKETHAIIQWLSAYDNHAEISFYFVEYSTSFHPNVWKNVATIVNGFKISFYNFQSINVFSPTFKTAQNNLKPQ